MKKLLSGIILILCVQTAYTQNNALQYDEENKYVYYEIKEKPGVTADTLKQRAAYFINHLDLKKANKSVTTGNLVFRDKFVVYTNALISKKEAGEIIYTLNVDIKDQRYRYKFSGFTFTPYKINRYGNMTVVPGIEIPLEKLLTTYNKKDTDSYLDQTAAFCKSASDNLKQFMDKVIILKAEPKIKQVKTDNWR